MFLGKDDPVLNINAERVIRVASTSLGPKEEQYVLDCLRRNWLSQGPMVQEFEDLFAAAHGQRTGVACNSGTTALHLALAALDVGPGDEVIVPTMTMVACFNAILYCGARPVFADSEANGNISVPHVRSLLSSRTKAIIAVHLYGEPCDSSIFDLGHERIPVIEDCAEAHYARFEDGLSVGSRGVMACFSFYGNKIVSCGEGGMVITSVPELSCRLESLRAHAFSESRHFQHKELAFGYRMTDMQAAVALGQHERREELLAARRQVAAWYAKHWGEPTHVRPAGDRSAGSVWWVYPILCDDGVWPYRVREALAAAGVEHRTYFAPLHRQGHGRRYGVYGHYPVADRLARTGLYLPLHPGVSEADVAYICRILNAAS